MLGRVLAPEALPSLPPNTRRAAGVGLGAGTGRESARKVGTSVCPWMGFLFIYRYRQKKKTVTEPQTAFGLSKVDRKPTFL